MISYLTGIKGEALVADLDMGAGKVCIIVSLVSGDGLEIIGMRTSLSRGVRNGTVVNMDDLVRSISEATAEVERTAPAAGWTRST